MPILDFFSISIDILKKKVYNIKSEAGDIETLSGDFTLTLKFRGDFKDASLDEFIFKK